MKKVEKSKIVCAECGKEFYLLECQRKNGRGKFCSKSCADNHRHHGSRIFCAMCDREFYRRFGEQQDAINQFCSKGCYRDWRVLNKKRDTYLKSGAVHIHRIVAESLLGRRLTTDEVVHHIDENRANNHPSNLAVFPDQNTHARCHFGEMSRMELSGFLLVKDT